MAQVHPLPKATATDDAPMLKAGTIRSIDSTTCALCGAKLSARALRHHVISPLTCDAALTVCHTCQRAALGEGYRPVE